MHSTCERFRCPHSGLRREFRVSGGVHPASDANVLTGREPYKTLCFTTTLAVFQNVYQYIQTDARNHPPPKGFATDPGGMVQDHITHMCSWLTSRCARSATGNAKTRLRATLDFHGFFARLRFPVVARQSTPQSKEGTVSTHRKQVGTHQQQSSLSVKYRTIFRR